MYPEEVKRIDEIFDYLTEVTASPPQPSPISLTTAHVDSIIQILERWPPSQRFPGMGFYSAHVLVYENRLLSSPVIDLSRLLAGFCHTAFATLGLKDRFFEALFKASEWNTSWALPLPKHRETNILLLFRTIANIFQEETTLDGTWVGKVFNLPYCGIQS
jgi:phospholipase A-2-activating protein